MKGKVLTFTSEHDTTQKNQWNISSIIENGDTLLVTKITDARNKLTDSLVEKILGNKTIIKSYRLFEYNSNNDISYRDAEIKDSVVFDFQQKLNQSVGWTIKYLDFSSTDTLVLSKKRTLVEITETNTLKFKDEFVASQRTKGQLYSYTIFSYYERNKGLIRYTIQFPDGTENDFRLVSR